VGPILQEKVGYASQILIFIFIYACNHGKQDGRLLDMDGYCSGIILPNIDWHIHYEAFLNIYLFGIIVVLRFMVWCGGLLSILASFFSDASP
jgi:hypothetical protein